MKKNNKLTILEVKKFLKEKGLKILRNTDYKKKIKFGAGFKNFYLTGISSIAIILISVSLPYIVILKNNFMTISKETTNNSKTNLEKVLSGKSLESESDDLDSAEIFEDIFKEDLPTDTVRLSASTIQQLFKDTNYNLKDVRNKKSVKPINLSLLPKEIKMIESSKKRKEFFIQIILPLILEENNQLKFNRKKLFNILNKNHNSASERNWLNKKFKQYGVKNKDLSTLKVRMDEIPVSLVIAQAAKETGWGTSRFALEGNALFGQWTYSGAGLKPLGVDTEQTHKVMKFKILKASIKAYQRNLNTHSSYKKFRQKRAELRDNSEELDSLILADYLDKYAETGKEYTKILKQIIKQNNLRDFDDVKLLPTNKKLKNLI